MPTTISKHSFARKGEKEFPRHKATDGPTFWGSWALDAVGSTRLWVNGAQIRGRSKTKVEDGAQTATTKIGSGHSVLSLALAGCTCPEWRAEATLRVRHHLIYSGSIGAGTETTVNLVGVAEALGTVTELLGEGSTATTEAGSLTHSEESKGKIEADLGGNAKGSINGTDVDGSGNVKVSHEGNTSTTKQQKLLSSTGGSIGGHVTKEFDKTYPLQCGGNSFDARSSLSMTMQSKAIDKETGWLRSRCEFMIQNELRVAAVTVKECPDEMGRQADRVLIIPELALLTPEERRASLAPGAVAVESASVAFANLPAGVGVDTELISVELAGLAEPVVVRLVSSNPEVLDVKPVGRLEPGAESVSVYPTVHAPGRAVVTVQVEELGFEEAVEIQVHDFAALEPGIYGAPERVEIRRGERRTVRLVTIGAEAECGVRTGDRSVACAAITRTSRHALDAIEVTIDGLAPGQTMLQLVQGSRKDSVDVLVEEYRGPAVFMPAAVSVVEGLPVVLPLSRPFPGSMDIRCRVEIANPAVCRLCHADVTIPAGERAAVVELFPVAAGHTMLTAALDGGETHCVRVRVREEEATSAR